MKRSLLLFSVVLGLSLGLASCEDPIQDVTPEERQQPVEHAKTDSITFTASLEQGATKTMLSPSVTDPSKWEVLWSQGDQIKVFNADNREGKVYTLNDESIGLATGSFSGPAISGSGPFYAVYPASAATSLGTDGSIGLTVPDTQVYDGPYDYIGVGANISAGYANTESLTGVAFKNLFGVLSLNVTNANNVSQVVLYTKGMTDVLNGSFTLTGLQDNAPVVSPVAGQATEPHQKLTLTCGEAGGDSRVFNLAVPEGVLDAGMTIELYDNSNGAQVVNAGAYSGTTDHFINRSHVRPMPEFPYGAQYKAGFLNSDEEAAAYLNIYAATSEGLSAMFLYDESVQYVYNNTSSSRMFRLQEWGTSIRAIGISLPSFELEPGTKVENAEISYNIGTNNTSVTGNVKVLKKTASRIWVAGYSSSAAVADQGFIIMNIED